MILSRNQPASPCDFKGFFVYSFFRRECMEETKNIFRFLSPHEKTALLVGSQSKNYDRAKTVFREGETPTGIFSLQTGKVKIFKMGNDGQQQIVRLAKPGDLLGYRAILSGEDYNATAETLESSTICHYRKDSFLKTLNISAVLKPHFLEHLCADLRFAEDRLLDFVQKPARERVAATLVLLMEAYGKSLKNGQVLIDASLSRREIAELSGVVLETAVRLLADFKEKKWVGFEGKKIIVFDKFKLLEISDTSAHLVSWR